MIRSLIFTTFLLIILTSCSPPTQTQTPPKTIPSPTVVPPPVQGPAVLGDNVEIEAWQYLGPEAVEAMPNSSTTVRNVDVSPYEMRLVRKNDGFELIWFQVACATYPVVVVHPDAVIEFWHGEVPFCEAMGVLHQLTVQWQTDIAFEDWKFIFHPPPEPES